MNPQITKQQNTNDSLEEQQSQEEEQQQEGKQPRQEEQQQQEQQEEKQPRQEEQQQQEQQEEEKQQEEKQPRQQEQQQEEEQQLQEDQQEEEHMLSSISTFGTGNEINKRLPFPAQLHHLLDMVEKQGNADIISWMPCGTAFKVHKREEFVERIMKKHFRQTVYRSFVRQLNLWGFERISCRRGSTSAGGQQHPDPSYHGAYQRQDFRRDNPEISLTMSRKYTKEGDGLDNSNDAKLPADERGKMKEGAPPVVQLASPIIQPNDAILDPRGGAAVAIATLGGPSFSNNYSEIPDSWKAATPGTNAHQDYSMFPPPLYRTAESSAEHGVVQGTQQGPVYLGTVNADPPWQRSTTAPAGAPGSINSLASHPFLRLNEASTAVERAAANDESLYQLPNTTTTPRTPPTRSFAAATGASNTRPTVSNTTSSISSGGIEPRSLEEMLLEDDDVGTLQAISNDECHIT